MSIPHLTELAKKFSGKVTFSGVSVYEHVPDATALVKKVGDFVTGMGDKMVYNVCVDDVAGTMGKTWMEAAGQGGIPTAFVVNGDGIVAWIGHPMGGLEESLDQMMAGKFDLAKSKKDFMAAAEQTRKQTELNKAIGAANQDYAAGKKKEAIAALDKLAEANPDMRQRIQMIAIGYLIVDDYAAAAKRVEAFTRNAKPDSAMIIAQLGMGFVMNPKLATDKKASDLGIKLLDQSNSLTKSANLPILNMLATAHWQRKEVSAAIECQQKVVDLLPTSEYKGNADIAKQMADQLQKYKAGLK
jgi:hypothetical protein